MPACVAVTLLLGEGEVQGEGEIASATRAGRARRVRPAGRRAGAVSEVAGPGVTGGVFDSLDALVEGLPTGLALDRSRVRSRAVQRFGPDRMVGAHVEAYSRLVPARRGAARTA